MVYAQDYELQTEAVVLLVSIELIINYEGEGRRRRDNNAMYGHRC